MARCKAAVSSVDLPSTPPPPYTPCDASPIEFTSAETKFTKGPKLSARTDYTRWRLLDEAGRQTWHYLETDEAVKAWPQSIADKWHLNMPTVRPNPQDI
jgi:lanosterol synthase